MFTDTPKLQPISKSKPNNTNVPSNSSNKNSASMSSVSSSINKDVTTGECKDSYLSDTAKDNRCNYGSYRNYSFQNQNYQRNYRNCEFNDYYSNQSNNCNSSYWASSWDNSSAYNQNYNRWNSNYNRHQKSYRSNLKYTSNNGYNINESFAEDSFQCNNFNIEGVVQPEADKVKSLSTKNTKLPKKKLTPPNRKNPIVNKEKTNSIQTKQFSHKKNVFSQDRKSGMQNKFTKNNLIENKSKNVLNSKTKKNIINRSSEATQVIESCNSSKSHSEQLSTLVSLTCSEITSDSSTLVNELNENSTRTLNPSVPSVCAEVKGDKTKSEISKIYAKENLKTNNVSAIASNANVIEKQTEEFLNSYPTDKLNLSVSIAQHSKNTSNELINSKVITKNQYSENTEHPVTVLKSKQILPPPTNSNSLSESENFKFHIPKISLIPLSRLIASDFWESVSNESLVSLESSKAQSTPNTPHKQVFKPNLIKRKRNVSTCSNSSTSSQNNSATDRLVEKLVTMNKINLKNIINSCDTRYDEALKTQARKRLREEIRRQLKSMNIEPQKDPISSDFVPDEIVDTIDIPDVVFEEIKKALGLELFTFSEDINMKTIEDILLCSNPLEENTNKDDSTNHLKNPAEIKEDSLSFLPQELVQIPKANENLTQNVLKAPDEDKINVPQIDQVEVKYETKPEIKMDVSAQKSNKSKRRHSRSKLKKLSKRRESHKSKRHRSPNRLKDDVVVLISSSSESSTSSSSSSATSSSSSSTSSSSSDSESDKSVKSNRSTCSANKKRRLKLKVDAENIVDSFEKLVLSSLSESLRERYRTKYSTSISTKLHFISCICYSNYNYGHFSKLHIAKVQKNLKSSDCSMALEFLMKEIVNVCNKQKHVAKMDDCRRGSSKSVESAKDTSEENSKGSSCTKRINHTNNSTPTRGKTSNGIVLKPSSSLPSSSETIQAKSVNAAQKIPTGTNGGKHLQECVTKVLSLYRQEMKVAMQSKETRHQQPSPSKFPTTAEQLTRKQQPTSMKPSPTSEDINAGNAKQTDEINSQNPINPINQQQTSQSQQQRDIGNENPNNDNEHSHTTPITNGRHCNTTDEKKRVIQAPTHLMQMPTLSSSNLNSVSTALSNLSTSLMGVASESYSQQPSFPVVDLETLKNQNPIGEVVVHNLREIDVKLMELHKRKMYIEEMILKLQKDKMEADLLTIKLQNEKFILLNTAMTANVSSSSMANNNNNCSQKQESAVKNIKTETIIISDTPTLSEMPPENCKKVVKSRSVRKAPVAKKLPVSRKRKTPPNVSTTTENAKKKSKEIKPPPKKTTKSSLKTTSKTPRKTTIKSITKKPTESVAQQMTSILPEELSPPEKIQTAEINNNPNTSIIDANVQAVSEITKPSYKNMATGSLEGIRNPITQIRVFEEFIIASSEDGKLYKFDVNTLQLLIHFSKHSEAITQMYLCREKKVIYTTSLDGYLKKSSLENFALDIQSIYLQEPLQSIAIQWDLAFIGSRWGNIYTYNLTTNTIADQALCCTDSSIISIKATQEADRKILIISSKGNLIHLRDATSGIVLRKFDVPESINIYSILLNEGVVYCGTQKKEIRKYDYVSGAYLGAINCGNGAVSMQMYNNKFLFVGCYDGFIYILNKATGKQVGRLAGSGKLILTFEIVEDKIITSAKDNTMKVSDIPRYCLDTNTKTN